MAKYFVKAKNFLENFEEAFVVQVSRANNATVDQLARLASLMAAIQNRNITFILSGRAAIEEHEEIMCIDLTPLSWKEEIIIFLTENQRDAKALRRKTSYFIMIDGELYKRGFSQLFLKCLTPDEGNYVLRGIHEGICENHLGGKALAGKSLGKGFFWPTKLLDAHELAYRTPPRTATGDSPFSLSYGTKAVAAAEIEELSWHVKYYNSDSNEQGLRMNLDLVKETREIAAVRPTMYKARMGKAYNTRVRPRSFQVGDLVMRKAEAGPIGKLDLKWEGLYKIIKILNGGAYK
ncbi:hypothetical protein Sango_1879200 [Sesamum angolense]|uniref:Uncharacterized protein n=1 Tax=Sesamum angolense TaxID=2727404 RepID=A0AAE2BQJ5_9LAMI|nr:hypothetical protein Sango_1879200 [Sesamum angolense]